MLEVAVGFEDVVFQATQPQFRRRKISQIYVHRRNFIGFYGASEIFPRPRKQRYAISPVPRKMGYFSPPSPQSVRRRALLPQVALESGDDRLDLVNPGFRGGSSYHRTSHATRPPVALIGDSFAFRPDIITFGNLILSKSVNEN